MASVIRGSGTSSLGGDLDIEGVLTYEDVASVDSVGVITARSGINVGTGTSISSPSSNVLTLGTNSSERLRITSGGSVGIGTVTPARTVSVFDTSAPIVALQNSTTGVGSEDGFQFQLSVSTGYIVNYESAPIIFYTAGTEKLHLTSDGDLGLGVSDNMNQAGTLYIVGGQGVRWSHPTGSTLYGDHYVNSSGSHVFRCGSSLSEKLRLTSDGKLILSMTQRTTPHASQGDGAAFIEQSYDGNLYGLMLRNKDTGSSAATSLGFSLNRTGSDYDFVSGQIKSIKEQSWTTTDSTIDSAMVFSTRENNTLRERLRITSLGQTIYYGESGNAGGTTATNQGALSANGTLDLKIPGSTFVGHLYVTSVYTLGALTRSTAVYFVSARLNNGATITLLNSANGSSGGRTFTITEVSGGSFPNKLRFTDTSNSAVTVTMHFVGAVGL